MKTILMVIALAACVSLTAANGRGIYMGMYPYVDGRRCANDCSYLPPGNHPSCYACNMYATCDNGLITDFRLCPDGLEWDNFIKVCNWPEYSTCYKEV